MSVNANILITKVVDDNDKAKDFFKDVNYLLTHPNDSAMSTDYSVPSYKIHLSISEQVPPSENPS